MEPLEEARIGEYYGEQRISVPSENETVGQDLINRRMADGHESGPPNEGYSTDTVLALMDPREFSENSEFFTRQLRKLAGSGLPRSRTVDTAIRRSDRDRKVGIEASLIYVSIAIWQVRVGETSCSNVSDMIQNTLRILQRIDFARTLTLEGIRTPHQQVLAMEYFAFLERFYVRMYAQPLRMAMWAKFQQLRHVWESKTDSLWKAMPCPMQGRANFINIQEPRVIRARYSSAPRSRSPRR